MLIKLFIKNYILIDEVTLHFEPNLNIITGETGAGKSILLGALGLILGNRAEASTIYNPENKCIIEGIFDLENKDVTSFFLVNELDYQRFTIIRRELSPTGVSRSFVNDTPVTLSVLKMLSEQLVDVHSQHETTLLFSPSYQLKLVDAFANQLNEVKEYSILFDEFQNLKKEIETLQNFQQLALKDRDYIQFQYQELEDAKLIDEDEQTKAEQVLQLLINSDSIQQKLNVILQSLNEPNTTIDLLATIENTLKGLAMLLPSFDNYRERANTAYIEMKEMANDLQHELNNTQTDDQELAKTQERINELYRLQKKHKTNDLASLIAIRNEFEKTLELTENYTEQIKAKINIVEKLENKLIENAKTLTKKRTIVIPKIEHFLHEKLKELLMGTAQCKIEMQTTALNSCGCDSLQILFAANKGQPLSELRKVASGGELARLMLLIKSMVAQQLDMPTLVFDEIDTGISGEVALRVGKAMEQLALKKQIITITHLPQIAARNGRHFFVFKSHENSKTQTFIKQLNEEERINEIAKMVSGDVLSEKSTLAAKELLSL